ncbi:MAG: YdeI/OmpD-associated family protein [Monoglobaceae bacterium]
MTNYEMPIGLGMALAQNPGAMEKFAALSDEAKREIIDGTHHVSSKEEMQMYVDKIMKSYK